MTPRYEIVVKKIEHKDYVEKKYEKIADTGNEKDDGPVYDYVELPITKKFDTEIYRQSIDSDDFDLKAIIDAFNGVNSNQK